MESGQAVTLAALDEGIAPSEAARLVDLIKRARICFDWDEDPPAIFAFERPQAHGFVGWKGRFVGIERLHDDDDASTRSDGTHAVGSLGRQVQKVAQDDDDPTEH